MLEEVFTQALALPPAALSGLGCLFVMGTVMGASRLLRPASFERAGELFGTDDPLVGLLLSCLAALGLLWFGYEWSLTLQSGREGAGATLALFSAAGFAGILLGETLRARREGTAGPVRRLATGLLDGSSLRAVWPGRRLSPLTDLRLASALYLFDPLRASARVWTAAQGFVPDTERDRAASAFARMARYALAFDDLKQHGLRRRDRADAIAVVTDLARMGKLLGCLDPATLADIRLIGAALGLQASELRQILLRETGMGGDWTKARTWSQTRTSGARYHEYSQSRRQTAGGGFGRSSGGPKPSGREAHYAVLGLSPGASATEVKAAWRRMAKRYHPDRFAGTDMTETERRAVETRMRDVNAAYEVLKS